MRGGKRENAGRPKGSKDPHTLVKEKVQEAMNQRVFRIANSLLNPQISLAKGQQFLYRIDTETVGGKKVKSKPILVENPDEIVAYLDWLEGDGESPNDDSVYYYITTKEPNNMAIDSLLNRTLGKPKESVEHTGNVNFTLENLFTNAKSESN